MLRVIGTQIKKIVFKSFLNSSVPQKMQIKTPSIIHMAYGLSNIFALGTL